MSCGPGIVGVPHFGCCGIISTGQAAITLRATFFGWWEHSLSASLHPTPLNVFPYHLHQSLAFDISLPGGRRWTQIARCPDRFSPPVIVSTTSTNWDITGGPGIGGVLSETPTSITYAFFGSDGVSTFQGTASYVMAEGLEPAPIIAGLYDDLASLTEWPTDAYIRANVEFPRWRDTPFTLHGNAQWRRANAGLLFEGVGPDLITDFFGNVTGSFRRPAMGGHHLLRSAGPDVPFTRGGTPIASMTHEITKVLTGVTSADEWIIRHGTNGGVFWDGRPLPSEAELSCRLGVPFAGGIVQAPPSSLLPAGAGLPGAVTPTDFRASIRVHSVYSFPPMSWPGGIVPSCRPDLGP